MGRLCCFFSVIPSKKTCGCCDTFAANIMMLIVSTLFCITVMVVFRTTLMICLLGLPITFFNVAWVLAACLKKKEVLGCMLILHKLLITISLGISCYYLYYLINIEAFVYQEYIILLVIANIFFFFTDCSLNKYEESFDLYSDQSREPAYQNMDIPEYKV